MTSGIAFDRIVPTALYFHCEHGQSTEATDAPMHSDPVAARIHSHC